MSKKTLIEGASVEAGSLKMLDKQNALVQMAFMALLVMLLSIGVGAFSQAQAAFDITENFSGITVPANGQNTDWGTIWQGVNSSESKNAWCGWNDNTPSNNSGTDTTGGGAGGAGDNFVFLEGSGATADPTNCSKAISSPSDNYFQTINQYDAGSQKIYMTYDYNPNFDGTLNVEYQVNGTGAWTQVGTPPTSNLADQWLSSSTYDFDAAGANTGNIRIRFKLTTAGSAFANDGGLDNIRIWGVDRDVTPPNASGSLAVSPESGSFVPASFTVTENFTDGESTISGCEYNLGSGWSAASWSAPTCTANVSGQTDGANLTIEMRATSTGGTGTSGSLARTVDDAGPSDGTLTATAGNAEVDLSWTAASDSGAGLKSTNTYKVVRGNAGAGAPANCSSGTQVYLGTGLSTTATGLSNGSSYGFRVCAYDEFDNVSTGSTDSATPTACSDTNSSSVTISNPVDSSSVSGSVSITVNLNNAATAQYSIDGGVWTGVVTPWDTTGTTGPAAATVDVRAVEDECGGYVTDSVSVTIDNRVAMGAGTASATPGGSQLGISAPYTGDINATGTVNIEWTLDTDTTFASPIGTQLLSDNSNPYAYTITGLSDGTAYRVRVTYADATDGVTGTAVQTLTGLIPVNPLMHNSLSAGSTKWGGDWGVNGSSKYGEFTCETCHSATTTNIKRIKTSIDAPDTGDDFPAGNNAAVTFTDARAGSSDFGAVDGAHATSDKVCEVCHTYDVTQANGVKVHAYNMSSASAGDQNHYLQSDCMSCHQHKQGFKAGCDSCHGNPPTQDSELVYQLDPPDDTGSRTWGEHQKHAVDLAYDCNSCHNGWQTGGEMPKSGDLNIGFDAYGVTGGSYNGRTGGAGYTAGSGTTVNTDDTMTCANYCHGSTIGGSNADWNDGVGGACGACHTATNATVDSLPSSTSHNTHAKVQNQACVNCHGAGYTSGSAAPAGHVDGSVRYDVTTLDGSKRYVGGTPVTYRGTSSGAETGAAAPSGTYGSCTNINCHYGNTTPAWDDSLGAYPARCVSCHNDGTAGTALINAAPDNGVHGEHLDGDDMDSNYVSGLCNDCHGANASTGAHSGHGDPDTAVVIGGEISSYPGDGSCANSCHQTDATTTEWSATGTIQCDDCHRNGFIGPVVVDPTGSGTGISGSSYGSHMQALSTDTINGSTNWQTQCSKCHGYHTGDATVELPPSSWTDPSGRMSGTNMRTQLGINYTITNGIHLGGTATSGSTEAEICWGCHDNATNNVSEWGYNTKTTDAGFPVVQLSTHNDGTAETYNHGWIYTNSGGGTKTSDWTTGYFIDSYRNMLKRPISSVHSVNFTAGNQTNSVSQVPASGVVPASPTLEAKGNIRCSYCHDVHNTHGGASTDGAPFLRGSWMGNPYPPDLPPLAADEPNYPTSGGPTKPQCNDDGARFSPNWTGTGTAPRLWGYNGDNVSRGKGGFFIDQNSNDPTSGKTVADTAGLCTLCHGSSVDDMDYYTGSTLWRGIQDNGHANSTLGGSGTGRVKIFDARRGGGTYQMAMQNQLGRGQWELSWGFGNLNPVPACGTSDIAPIYVTGWYGTGVGNRSGTGSTDGWDDWYSSGSQVAKQNYHKFSCSKCHSPHASKLPALLTTNCLDAGIATWEGTTDGADPSSTAANNCHRNDSAEGDGWNRLAPNQND